MSERGRRTNGGPSDDEGSVDKAESVRSIVGSCTTWKEGPRDEAERKKEEEDDER